MQRLRRRQTFGKFIIEERLGEGGFATVYRARDTIEGTHVALKIPKAELVDKEMLELFQREVRLAAKIDHPNVLGLKYADFIEGQFVVVTAAGEETLESRLRRRLATTKALNFAEQMLSAVACAHSQKIVHCDIKPENFIVFPGDRLRLADFGIAIVAQRTVQGSGAGTVGYMAPEQALGRPSMRSDVFSLGLVMHRMFSGALPEWPFPWPGPAHRRLASRLQTGIVSIIQRATEVDSRKRFANAEQMLSAFCRVPSTRRTVGAKSTHSNGSASKRRNENQSGATWRSVRFREFQRRFKKSLESTHQCSHCHGPMAESMAACPWCGKEHRILSGETTLAEQCPRCARGMKADWRYCPWCHGGGFEASTKRVHSDKRYSARIRCPNAKCKRKQLFPFMRYCPWCNAKVRKPWKIHCIDGTPAEQCKCADCGWGVLHDFWNYCPWCAATIATVRK